MIFNCPDITKWVGDWQETKDKDTLAAILKGSQALVEAVVSGYNPEHRADLIQESLLKITHALSFYDKSISNLYAYLSVVIRNACITYLLKISKEVLLPDDMDWPAASPEEDDYEILFYLIERNRKRFPSLPVDIVDDASEDVYYAIRDGVRGKSRGAIAELISRYGFPRNIATVFYHSSMIFLRMVFVDKFSINGSCNEREFTLLPELANVVGPTAFGKMAVVFSGTYVKIP